MANLPESPNYHVGIYQLEKTDPVEAGPSGIANRQAEQLGDRTAWLHQEIAQAADDTGRLLLDHSHLAALFGQLSREAARLRAAQGETPPLSSAVAALSAIIGQLARQTNGGRITLAGGSLDDPALRIGTASIYSTAADTLSVAVAGAERLRITTSGITVFGTVTEA